MTNKANLPKEKIAEIKLKKNESKIFNYGNRLKNKKQIYILTNVYEGYIIQKPNLIILKTE